MFRTPVPISFVELKLRVVPASITHTPVLYTDTFKLMITSSEVGYHHYRYFHSPSYPAYTAAKSYIHLTAS
jgi:hypothetical protein